MRSALHHNGGGVDRPRLTTTMSSIHSDSGISAGHLEHPGSRDEENNYFQTQGQESTTTSQSKWGPPPYTTGQPQMSSTSSQNAQLQQYATLDSSTASTRQNLRSGLEELQNQQVFTPPAGSNTQFWNTASALPQASFFPDTMAGKPWPDFSSMDLGPVSEMPPFSVDGLDPLQGFDIPFWMGHDNTAAWMNHG